MKSSNRSKSRTFWRTKQATKMVSLPLCSSPIVQHPPCVLFTGGQLCLSHVEHILDMCLPRGWVSPTLVCWTRVVSVCLYVFVCRTINIFLFVIVKSRLKKNTCVIFCSLTLMFSMWLNETSTGVVDMEQSCSGKDNWGEKKHRNKCVRTRHAAEIAEQRQSKCRTKDGARCAARAATETQEQRVVRLQQVIVHQWEVLTAETRDVRQQVDIERHWQRRSTDSGIPLLEQPPVQTRIKNSMPH